MGHLLFASCQKFSHLPPLQDMKGITHTLLEVIKLLVGQSNSQPKIHGTPRIFKKKYPNITLDFDCEIKQGNLMILNKKNPAMVIV